MRIFLALLWLAFACATLAIGIGFAVSQYRECQRMRIFSDSYCFKHAL